MADYTLSEILSKLASPTSSTTAAMQNLNCPAVTTANQEFTNKFTAMTGYWETFQTILEICNGVEEGASSSLVGTTNDGCHGVFERYGGLQTCYNCFCEEKLPNGSPNPNYVCKDKKTRTTKEHCEDRCRTDCAVALGGGKPFRKASISLDDQEIPADVFAAFASPTDGGCKGKVFPNTYEGQQDCEECFCNSSSPNSVCKGLTGLKANLCRKTCEARCSNAISTGKPYPDKAPIFLRLEEELPDALIAQAKLQNPSSNTEKVDETQLANVALDRGTAECVDSYPCSHILPSEPGANCTGEEIVTHTIALAKCWASNYNAYQVCTQTDVNNNSLSYYRDRVIESADAATTAYNDLKTAIQNCRNS